jgi:hypothetical protein
MKRMFVGECLELCHIPPETTGKHRDLRGVGFQQEGTLAFQNLSP